MHFENYGHSWGDQYIVCSPNLKVGDQCLSNQITSVVSPGLQALLVAQTYRNLYRLVLLILAVLSCFQYFKVFAH